MAELAPVVHGAGAWLHVDAAYAGSAWVCPELRWTQAGVEQADSFVDAMDAVLTKLERSLGLLFGVGRSLAIPAIRKGR